MFTNRGLSYLTLWRLQGILEMRKINIKEVKNMLVTLDSQNRVTLGKLLKGISTRLFEAQLVNGKIVLEPMEAIPEKEAWLYKNPKALQSVIKGLQDAKEGKIKELNLDEE